MLFWIDEQLSNSKSSGKVSIKERKDYREV